MKNFTKISLTHKTITLFIVVLCLISIGLMGNSFYIHAKAQLAQILIKNAWEETTHQNSKKNQLSQPIKPWSWADTFPVARLVVANHQVDQFILSGASGSPLAFGPGLYHGTQLPGHKNVQQPDSVIAGHHNTHFSFLKKIKLEDQFYIQTFSGENIQYKVNNIKVYDINQSQLPVTYQGKTIKLVTCLPNYPGEINPSKRLVINAVQMSHSTI